MSRENFLERLLGGMEVAWKPLGEIAETYGGLTGKIKSDFDGGESRYVSYKNIFDNLSVDLQSLEPVNIAESENQNSIRFGDVLFTGSSETPDEVGMSSVVMTPPARKSLFK
jgi:type I restriction enzyme S subunit